jgi:hypothetical protein
VPESRHRYLYERLGDHDFQQLVSALLASQFPDYRPMALRQTDGGIDGLRNIDPKTFLIYQVKWSASGTAAGRDPPATDNAPRSCAACMMSPRMRHAQDCRDTRDQPPV